MSNTNNITVSGNLSKDAEFSKVGEHSKLSFQIGNNVYAGKDKTHTNWLNIECWRLTADWNRELKKGEGVLVIGQLRIEQYEKDGMKKSATKIVAEKIIKLAKNDKSNIKQDESENNQQEAGDGLPF